MTNLTKTSHQAKAIGLSPDRVSDDFKEWVANGLRTQAAHLDAYGYHEEATEKLQRAERLESLMEGENAEVR